MNVEAIITAWTQWNNNNFAGYYWQNSTEAEKTQISMRSRPARGVACERCGDRPIDAINFCYESLHLVKAASPIRFKSTLMSEVIAWNPQTMEEHEMYKYHPDLAVSLSSRLWEIVLCGPCFRALAPSLQGSRSLLTNDELKNVQRLRRHISHTIATINSLAWFLENRARSLTKDQRALAQLETEFANYVYRADDLYRMLNSLAWGCCHDPKSNWRTQMADRLALCPFWCLWMKDPVFHPFVTDWVNTMWKDHRAARGFVRPLPRRSSTRGRPAHVQQNPAYPTKKSNNFFLYIT